MRKCFNYAFIFFIFFYLTAPICSGIEPDRDTIIKSQKKMQRMHEKEQNILERQNKEQELLKELDKLIQDRKTSDKNASEGNVSEKPSNFLITEIILENATLINKSQKAKLTSGYINKKLTIKDINALIKEIKAFYLKSGYPTARVRILPKQNFKSGTLKIFIIETVIEDIKIGEREQTIKDKLKIFTAYPFLKKKKLNVRDIEQGVEQFNRLASNKAVMNFAPGKKASYSKVIINNQPQDNRFRADITFDNEGQKSTGEIRRKLTLNKDNLIGINDNFTFSYTEDSQSDNNNKFSRAYYAGFSFPFGYWTLSGNYSHSEYMQTVKGLVTSFQTSGNSETAFLEIKKVIHRDQTTKTALNSSITLKSTESYLEDVKTDTSSRKLSVLKAGISHNRRIFKGIAYFNLDYYKGLKNFAAKEDPPDIEADSPKAQFQKYGFGITYYKPLTLFNQNIIWQLNFSSQYSPDVLFSSEKISIGDSSTVRGFKEDSIQGDNGFYLKNEIIFKKPQSPIFKGLLSKSDLFFAIDTGYVRENAGVESNYGEGKGGLTGWACGLRYNNDPFTFDITYSEPINSPNFIKENSYQIYFTVTFGLDNLFDKVYSHIFDKKQ